MNALEAKIARIRAGINQLQMADMLGLKQNTLSQYELGYRKFPAEILKRFLDIVKDHNPKVKS